MTADALRLQLTLYNDLCGNTGVIRPRNPRRVETAHAVVARQRVHDGLVESVAHMQRASDIGWWQLNRKRWLPCFGLASAAIPCNGVTPALPLGPPVRFNREWLKGFGEAFKAGLVDGGQCVGHGD